MTLQQQQHKNYNELKSKKIAVSSFLRSENICPFLCKFISGMADAIAPRKEHTIMKFKHKVVVYLLECFV